MYLRQCLLSSISTSHRLVSFISARPSLLRLFFFIVSLILLLALALFSCLLSYFPVRVFGSSALSRTKHIGRCEWKAWTRKYICRSVDIGICAVRIHTYAIAIHYISNWNTHTHTPLHTLSPLYTIKTRAFLLNFSLVFYAFFVRSFIRLCGYYR